VDGRPRGGPSEASLLAKLLADTQAELVCTTAAAPRWHTRAEHLAYQLEQVQRALPSPPTERPISSDSEGSATLAWGLSVTYKNHWTRIVDPTDDDALVPSMMGPEGLQILVSGGWGSASSQSIWIDSVHGELITRKIDWDWS
jgi:hypothetical protein